MTSKARSAIWYYIKNYKFNSLFIKNFSIIIALVVLPLCILGFVLYGNVDKMMREDISDTNVSSLNKIRDMSDNVIKEVDMLATNITLQNSIQMLMISKDFELIKSDTKNRIIDFIKNYTAIYRYIDSIYIYSEKNDVLLSNRENTYLENFSDKSWYDIYKQKKDNTVSIYPHSNNNAFPHFITVLKPITFGNNNVIGCVVINISTRYFGDLITTAENPINQDILIAYDKERVLHFVDNDLVVSNLEDIDYLYPLLQKASGNSEQIKIKNIESTVSIIDSKYYNYKYISIMPLSRYQEKIDNMSNFMLLIIFVVIFLGGVISFLISIKAFMPIKSIISIIDDPESWSNNTSYTNNKNNDELKYIINNITQNFESKKELEKELERRLALLDKSAFIALQAQINPHFLYNTLETINCLAIQNVGRKNVISDAILSLAQLFRISLETDNYLISIEQEVQYAKIYIDILNLRYGEIFKVAWDIDKDILDKKIIKICLQPIIENAIYHGIKPKDGGVIEIKGRLINGDIIIEIKDNGIGISKEEVEAINYNLRQKYSQDSIHIGIKNVNQRIKLIFGENYGINIISNKDIGTTVIIKISTLDKTK